MKLITAAVSKICHHYKVIKFVIIVRAVRIPGAFLCVYSAVQYLRGEGGDRRSTDWSQPSTLTSMHICVFTLCSFLPPSTHFLLEWCCSSQYRTERYRYQYQKNIPKGAPERERPNRIIVISNYHKKFYWNFASFGKFRGKFEVFSQWKFVHVLANFFVNFRKFLGKKRRNFWRKHFWESFCGL